MKNSISIYDIGKLAELNLLVKQQSTKSHWKLVLGLRTIIDFF